MGLLFALQVCPVDVREARELAELVCAIEPKTKQAEWLIAYRRDTPRDRIWNIQKALQAKFSTVLTLEAPRYANGWPAGSNALWLSTMLYAAELKASGQIQADGVLTFEADNVPMRKDWMGCLESAYQQRRNPIVGNLHRCPSIPDHINGNAIFPINFLAQYPQMLETPPIAAWDFHNRLLLLSLSQDSPYLTQLYQRKNLTLEEWRAIRKFTVRPALLHGVKDDSARKLARLELVGKLALAPPRKLVLQP